MNITDLITGGIGSNVTSAISKTLNIDEDKTKWLVAAAVPLMVAALNYNAKKSSEKAENINKALEQHDGSIFSQLDKLTDSAVSTDGKRIVQHIFGSNTDVVKTNLASRTGLSTEKIEGALALLAPLVMGFFGKQKKLNNGGVGDLIGNILGGQSSSGGGILGSLVSNIMDSFGVSSPTNQGTLSNLAGEFFNQNNNADKKGSVLDTLAAIFGK